MEEVDHPNNFKGHPNEQELKALHEKIIIQKKLARRLSRMATASLTWPLKPAEREYIRTQYKAGNFKPLIKTYQRFEKEKRKNIYKRSEGLHDERYWYIESPLYQEIKEFVQLPLDKRHLDGLSRHLSPEMVATIVRERWRLNKSQLLRLHDEEEILKGLLRKMKVQSNLP
jgi:hypothetical protein